MDSQGANGTPTKKKPVAGHVLEVAHSLANDGIRAASMQVRRLGEQQPEDGQWCFRLQADLQFLLVALQQVREAAVLAQTASASPDLQRALSAFDAATPTLRIMRNVAIHTGDYVGGKGRNRSVDPSAVFCWQIDESRPGGLVWHWCGQVLDTALYFAAGEKLYCAIRTVARPSGS